MLNARSATTDCSTPSDQESLPLLEHPNVLLPLSSQQGIRKLTTTTSSRTQRTKRHSRGNNSRMSHGHLCYTSLTQCVVVADPQPRVSIPTIDDFHAPS